MLLTQVFFLREGCSLFGRSTLASSEGALFILSCMFILIVCLFWATFITTHGQSHVA